MDDHKYYTIKEAAEALDVSAATIRRRIKSGKIKAELVPGVYGQEYRIKEGDLTGSDAGEVKDVVPISQEINKQEFMESLQDAMREGVKEGLDHNAEEVKELKEEIRQLRNTLERIEKAERKPWWQFWR